ncbi:unnamed protein product [Amoebophrya sp. A25]|nr:unnamed protein product [Amoebophrya sp. A25]|eukprot:GSA25T00000473001.1
MRHDFHILYIIRSKAPFPNKNKSRGLWSKTDRGDLQTITMRAPPVSPGAEIFVCQAGSCSQAGSAATLVEIEELVSASRSVCALNQGGSSKSNKANSPPGGLPSVCEGTTAASSSSTSPSSLDAASFGGDNVGSEDTVVRPSGCLGLCRQAPGVMVLRENRRESAFMRVRDVESSARVVEYATGVPATSLLKAQAPGAKQRLMDVRLARARQHATKVFKWNAALKGMGEQFETTGKNAHQDPKKFGQLAMEYGIILSNAGLWEESATVLSRAAERLASDEEKKAAPPTSSINHSHKSSTSDKNNTTGTESSEQDGDDDTTESSDSSPSNMLFRSRRNFVLPNNSPGTRNAFAQLAAPGRFPGMLNMSSRTKAARDDGFAIRQYAANLRERFEQVQNLLLKKVAVLCKHDQRTALEAMQAELEKALGLDDTTDDEEGFSSAEEEAPGPGCGEKANKARRPTSTKTGDRKGGGEGAQVAAPQKAAKQQQKCAEEVKEDSLRNSVKGVMATPAAIGMLGERENRVVLAVITGSIAKVPLPPTDEVNKKADTSSSTTLSLRRQLFPFPEAIDKYTKWKLTSVRPVSAHSAVFRFVSSDRLRGTPHPRGRGKTAVPNTWHVTLIAPAAWSPTSEGGFVSSVEDRKASSTSTDENEDGVDEGPLPWVERDYTPVSTAGEWERGVCEMLIKVYKDGRGTSWLHTISHAQSVEQKACAEDRVPHLQQFLFQQNRISKSENGLHHDDKNQFSTERFRDAFAAEVPIEVWLSHPVPTLQVPQLVTPGNEDSSGNGKPPASVLLVLGGTGVVAAPQILAFRDPTTKLCIATRKVDQLRVPVDLVLSCRKDDILMLPEVIAWCREGAGLPDPEASSSTSNNRRANDEPVGTRGLRSCVLHITKEAASAPTCVNTNTEGTENTNSTTINYSRPFSRSESDAEEVERQLSVFQELPNARVVEWRLDQKTIKQAVKRMPQPCRVVVSGPTEFNAAARRMLLDTGMLKEDALTILTA